MFYKEFLPTEPLRSYIISYAVLSDNCHPGTSKSELVPPILSKVIVFFYSWEDTVHANNGTYNAHLPSGYILPHLTRSTMWTYENDFASFGIRFYPGKFRHFFQMPMFEFINSAVPIEFMGDKGLVDLHSRMIDATSTHERVKLADAYLLTRLTSLTKHRDLIDEILVNLIRDPVPSIYDIRSKFKVSERHFRRLFKENMGIGPKQYQKQIRFSKALNLIEQGKYKQFSEISDLCGYSDPSHFVEQFKFFLDLTPKQFTLTTHPITSSLHWKD